MFTKADVGCYADGAFGPDYCREVLADLLESLPEAQTDEIKQLADELREDMSDDASEEYDAIDILNSHCADGVYFTFDSGDLLLVDDCFEP